MRLLVSFIGAILAAVLVISKDDLRKHGSRSTSISALCHLVSPALSLFPLLEVGIVCVATSGLERAAASSTSWRKSLDTLHDHKSEDVATTPSLDPVSDSIAVQQASSKETLREGSNVAQDTKSRDHEPKWSTLVKVNALKVAKWCCSPNPYEDVNVSRSRKGSSLARKESLKSVKLSSIDKKNLEGWQDHSHLLQHPHLEPPPPPSQAPKRLIINDDFARKKAERQLREYHHKPATEGRAKQLLEVEVSKQSKSPSFLRKEDAPVEGVKSLLYGSGSNSQNSHSFKIRKERKLDAASTQDHQARDATSDAKGIDNLLKRHEESIVSRLTKRSFETPAEVEEVAMSKRGNKRGAILAKILQLKTEETDPDSQTAKPASHRRRPSTTRTIASHSGSDDTYKLSGPQQMSFTSASKPRQYMSQYHVIGDESHVSDPESRVLGLEELYGASGEINPHIVYYGSSSQPPFKELKRAAFQLLQSCESVDSAINKYQEEFGNYINSEAYTTAFNEALTKWTDGRGQSEAVGQQQQQRSYWTGPFEPADSNTVTSTPRPNQRSNGSVWKKLWKMSPSSVSEGSVEKRSLPGGESTYLGSGSVSEKNDHIPSDRAAITSVVPQDAKNTAKRRLVKRAVLPIMPEEEEEDSSSAGREPKDEAKLTKEENNEEEETSMQKRWRSNPKRNAKRYRPSYKQPPIEHGENNVWAARYKEAAKISPAAALAVEQHARLLDMIGRAHVEEHNDLGHFLDLPTPQYFYPNSQNGRGGYGGGNPRGGGRRRRGPRRGGYRGVDRGSQGGDGGRGGGDGDKDRDRRRRGGRRGGGGGNRGGGGGGEGGRGGGAGGSGRTGGSGGGGGGDNSPRNSKEDKDEAKKTIHQDTSSIEKEAKNLHIDDSKYKDDPLYSSLKEVVASPTIPLEDKQKALEALRRYANGTHRMQTGTSPGGPDKASNSNAPVEDKSGGSSSPPASSRAGGNSIVDDVDQSIFPSIPPRHISEVGVDLRSKAGQNLLAWEADMSRSSKEEEARKAMDVFDNVRQDPKYRTTAGFDRPGYVEQYRELRKKAEQGLKKAHHGHNDASSSSGGVSGSDGSKHGGGGGGGSGGAGGGGSGGSKASIDQKKLDETGLKEIEKSAIESYKEWEQSGKKVAKKGTQGSSDAAETPSTPVISPRLAVPDERLDPQSTDHLHQLSPSAPTVPGPNEEQARLIHSAMSKFNGEDGTRTNYEAPSLPHSHSQPPSPSHLHDGTLDAITSQLAGSAQHSGTDGAHLHGKDHNVAPVYLPDPLAHPPSLENLKDRYERQLREEQEQHEADRVRKGKGKADELSGIERMDQVKETFEREKASNAHRLGIWIQEKMSRKQHGPGKGKNGKDD
ncbi:hypothetical protein CBS101457_002686 [Exobasidium rhododendri]|nr:hypothetical protein CBS101457_002686 [Exobasidium rhododendri]